MGPNFEAGQSPQERDVIRGSNSESSEADIGQHNMRLPQEFAEDPAKASIIRELIRTDALAKTQEDTPLEEKLEQANRWLESVQNRRIVPDYVLEEERQYFIVALAHELRKPEYNQ